MTPFLFPGGWAAYLDEPHIGLLHSIVDDRLSLRGSVGCAGLHPELDGADKSGDIVFHVSSRRLMLVLSNNGNCVFPEFQDSAQIEIWL